jgi:hypothetical protein
MVSSDFLYDAVSQRRYAQLATLNDDFILRISYELHNENVS